MTHGEIRVIGAASPVDFDSSMIDSVDSFKRLFKEHIQGIIDESASQRQGPLIVRAGRSLDFQVELSLPSQTHLKAIVKRIVSGATSEPKGIVDELCATIAQECRTFFGRYRWSTLFIEQFLKEILQETKGPMTLVDILNNVPDAEKRGESLVKDAATKAKRTVITALQGQLQRAKDEIWIESLYRLAIWADVFNQSSVIEDETARLVSEGFALVKNIGFEESPGNQALPANQNDLTRVNPNEVEEPVQVVRVWLCEPLAVDAVMSYLRTTKVYDKMMNQFFSTSSQLDNGTQAVLGKLAEFNLASVSAGLTALVKTFSDETDRAAEDRQLPVMGQHQFQFARQH